MLTRYEKEDDYSWIFSEIKNLCTDLFRVNMDLETIISDMAPAIKAAARKQFPDSKITDCWAHALK